jgi:hypothetical protein
MRRWRFQLFFAHASAPSHRVHFVDTNFPFGNPRKTGVLGRPEKTFNFFEKFACIENPLLISYSPVAPLRATPDG